MSYPARIFFHSIKQNGHFSFLLNVCTKFIVMQLPIIRKLGLGYRFDQDREVLLLIYFSYFYILLFSVVIILLHTSDEELVFVSYRYNSLILVGLLELLMIHLLLT